MLQSTHTIVHPSICVNTWQTLLPSADEARPGFCPRCRTPSRPIGGRINLEGHGLRTRQLRGPTAPNSPPTLLAVDTRRYRCRTCNAVISVIPKGMLPRRHFSAGAIAQAMARYGLAKQSRPTVRKHISPWQIIGTTAQTGWATLGRWITAIRNGTLLPCIRTIPAHFTPRQIAERAATTLAALGAC